MNKMIIIPAFVAVSALAGCRLVNVENFGTEVVKDSSGKVILLPDGSAQTISRGWKVSQRQHWLITEADSMNAAIKGNEVSFTLNGLNSRPDGTNLTSLVSASLTGAAELAAKVGAAIASSGGSVAADGVSAMVQRFVAKGGNTSNATITCKDGICTVTDGTISESCTGCSD